MLGKEIFFSRFSTIIVIVTLIKAFFFNGAHGCPATCLCGNFPVIFLHEHFSHFSVSDANLRFEFLKTMFPERRLRKLRRGSDVCVLFRIFLAES